MRTLRLLSLLLPLALMPGCVVAGDAYPAQGYAYGGGYGYAQRPYYAPRPTYYAPRPSYYAPPPVRYYAPPPVHYRGPPPGDWGGPPRGHWDRGRGPEARQDWRRDHRG